MIFRSFIIIFFAIFCSACNSETKSDHSDIGGASFESTLMSFSEAVSTGSTSKFADIANADGIHLVRKFTSGNLGGRGEELSSKTAASSLNDQMEFPVKNQTPLSLKILFPELPIKSYKELPQYKLPEIQEASFDQCAPVLTKALEKVPEAVEGDPVILTSGSSYWVYAEAQVIDGVLVGGFAVFKQDADRLSLVSIIEFL